MTLSLPPLLSSNYDKLFSYSCHQSAEVDSKYVSLMTLNVYFKSVDSIYLSCWWLDDFLFTTFPKLRLGWTGSINVIFFELSDEFDDAGDASPAVLNCSLVSLLKLDWSLNTLTVTFLVGFPSVGSELDEIILSSQHTHLHIL